MTWNDIRDHYWRVLQSLKPQGVTQATVAAKGRLSGQNVVSKLLANHTLGPQVETFVKAVQGLGMPLSEFFRQLETGEAPPAYSDQAPPSQAVSDDASSAAIPPPLTYEQYQAAYDAAVEALQTYAREFRPDSGHAAGARPRTAESNPARRTLRARPPRKKAPKRPQERKR